MRLGPLRRVAAPVMRWRTAKGFGVHSPFAFHFITRVLRERLPFYDFEQLPREARLLYRLTDYFCPVTACVVGGHAADCRRVMAMAHRSVRFVDAPSEAQMVVYTEDAGAAVCAGAEVTIVPAECGEALKRCVPAHTMTFSNGRVLIAVSRHGLPRQDFRLRF